MYRVLVHIHVYYIATWPKIETYLKNIIADRSCNVEIFVTVSNAIDDSKIYRIERSRIPNMSLIRAPNRGYDIEPFFYMLRSISLDSYNYIIKLHTKNIVRGIDMNFNGRYISRVQWPTFLFEAIAGSKKAFSKNIENLKNNSNLGMIASSYLINNVYYHQKEQREKEIYENYIHKLHAEQITNPTYVAGTMFIARSDIFKPLIEANLLNEVFEQSESRKLGDTKAHAIERLFGILVTLKGMKLQGFDKSRYKDLTTSTCAHAIKRFIFDKRITTNGRLLIRIFRIPIWNIKLKKTVSLH